MDFVQFFLNLFLLKFLQNKIEKLIIKFLQNNLEFLKFNLSQVISNNEIIIST